MILKVLRRKAQKYNDPSDKNRIVNYELRTTRYHLTHPNTHKPYVNVAQRWFHLQG